MQQNTLKSILQKLNNRRIDIQADSSQTTYIQTDRQTDRLTDRHTNIQTARHTDSQTHQRKDRRTERNTDRLTDKFTEILVSLRILQQQLFCENMNFLQAILERLELILSPDSDSECRDILVEHGDILEQRDILLLNQGLK